MIKEIRCKDCPNTSSFLQISKYGRGKREINFPQLRGFTIGPWRPDGLKLPPGVYCGNEKCPTRTCSEPKPILANLEYKNTAKAIRELIETPPANDAKDFKIDYFKNKVETGVDIKTRYENRKTEEFKFPGKPAEYGTVNTTDIIKKQFKIRKGIDLFYKHQAKAVDLIKRTKNVVIETTTASGKTECYQIPILEELLEDKDSTALLIYPLKALCRDQMVKFAELGEEEVDKNKLFKKPVGKFRIGEVSINFGAYDGDTGGREEEITRRRAFIREHGRLLFTNFDMLSRGILPNHKGRKDKNGFLKDMKGSNWDRFFKNLRYVVIDEMHYYTGVYGSHAGLVIRRLRRICDYYGADPVFILCSATIANPKEHAETLTGLKFEYVTPADNGAPEYEKLLIVWNPEWKGKDKKDRIAPGTEALNIGRFILSEIKYATLCFGKGRKEVRLLERDLKKRIGSELALVIASFIATDAPDTKAKLLNKIRSADYWFTFSTTALELGIDVGNFAIGIILGFPNSFASLRQQAGRVGRKGESVVFFIARNNPLDQYLLKKPQVLYEVPVEKAVINPFNKYILSEHLKAASVEIEIDITKDKNYFGEKLTAILEELKNNGDLGYNADDKKYYWLAPDGVDYPAEKIFIRSGSSKENIEAISGDKVVARIDAATALRDLHEGAVYLSAEDEDYEVTRLDLDKRRAYLRKLNEEEDFYTRASVISEVNINNLNPNIENKQIGKLNIYLGEAIVKRSVCRYYKIKRGKGIEEVSQIQFEEDEVERFIKMCSRRNVNCKECIERREYIKYAKSYNIETRAFWFPIPEVSLTSFYRWAKDITSSDLKIPLLLEGALHGLEHIIVHLLPRFAIGCAASDLGGYSSLRYQGGPPEFNDKPIVFIHESVPGGLGFVDVVAENFDKLVKECYERILDCDCENETGCYGCIQDPSCGSFNYPLDKKGTEIFLSLISDLINK